MSYNLCSYNKNKATSREFNTIKGWNVISILFCDMDMFCITMWGMQIFGGLEMCGIELLGLRMFGAELLGLTVYGTCW